MADASITSTRCSVCAHPDRLAIDHTLACGANQAATAERFGLGKDAINRHWSNHVSDTWKAATRVGPYGSRERLEQLCLDENVSVVEGLRALYSSYHAAYIASLEAGATNQIVTVGREIRAVLNDIARITGEILPSVTTNLTVNQQFNSVSYVTGISEELALACADMPDALDLIRGVLAKQMATALPAPFPFEGKPHVG